MYKLHYQIKLFILQLE